jgi:hypothetical protein
MPKMTCLVQFHKNILRESPSIHDYKLKVDIIILNMSKYVFLSELDEDRHNGIE